VARTATQATSGLLLVTGSAHLWELVALQAAYGAAEALSLPAQTGLVADVVAPERLQAANSLRAFARSVADVAGPALAGVLVVGFGAGWGLVVDAASFAAGAALLATVRAGTGVARTAASRLLADLRHGWRAFRGSAWLWRGVALMALWNGLYGMFAVLGPVVAARDHGGAAAWAAIGTAVGVGSVAGGLVLVRVRPRRPGVLMSGGLLCSCGPPIALATGVPLAGVIAAAVLSGAASVGFNATWESTVQREIPRDVLSRVAAYDMVGSFALGPVGTATGGLLAAPLGASALLLTMGVARFGLAAAFWAIPGIRALRGPS
jgi:predicted MFS family arabinose efflux permease